MSAFSVLVIGDPARPGVATASERIVKALDRRVGIAGVDLSSQSDLSGTTASLVLVLGGDGAILSAARRLGASAAPVLGVNFGKLGFLAGLPAHDLETAVVEVIVSRTYRVSHRMRLVAKLVRAGRPPEPELHGLNDAVVERWYPRSLSIDLIVDGVAATTYRGDGVIVATPTGSTAHSLAAGGPIVEPEMHAFVVSPMCAHSVSNRPLVLGAGQTIRLRVAGGSRHPGLAIDGQVLRNLGEGDEVEIRRSPHTFHLAVPSGRSFFDVLRTRLHWAGQPPYEGDGA